MCRDDRDGRVELAQRLVEAAFTQFHDQMRRQTAGREQGDRYGSQMRRVLVRRCHRELLFRSKKF